LLFVSAARRWTGGERCMVAVASGLARRGHAVLFAGDPRGPLLERVDPGVRRHAVRIRNDVDLAALWRLRELARHHAADTVCVNTFRELKLGGLAARLGGRAGVVNRMGTTDALYGGARERAIYGALLDVLVRDSEWGCRRVRRENPWLASPVLLARNGIDAERVAAVAPLDRETLSAGDAEVLVAVMGRGSAPYGTALAASLRAAIEERAPAADLQSLPPMRLVFVGDPGPAAEAGIRALLPGDGPVRASLLGWRSPEDAQRALAACDLLARPSATDGTAFAVLDAMALGKPVVAAAAGGLGEVVVDGQTGRLVPLEGPRAMALALIELAADPALRRRLGEAGRLRVRREFGEERMLDAYEAAFRLAAGHRRSRPASHTIAQASPAARSQLK
jgi:glycosyltransferase involved in cell wall biosynthesis